MRSAIVACACLLTGCSVLVDLDGLSAGAGWNVDAGVDASPDAAGGAGGTPGTGGAGGNAAPGFLDDFDRADGDVIGNGWTEKVPSAFALAGGAVTKLATPFIGYRDNMVYRPDTEDQLDVEASIEFRLPAPDPGYPQIFVRAQRSSIANPDTYDGYLLFIAGDPSIAVLGRQHGSTDEVWLVQLAVASSLDTASTYRLRLSVVGTATVTLTGHIERLDGSAWTVIAETTYQDVAPERIASPGAVGFGAHTEASPIYDDFRWQSIPP